LATTDMGRKVGGAGLANLNWADFNH